MILAEYLTVSSDLQARYQSVQAMAETLEGLLGTLRDKIGHHISDTYNPHRVTFEQAGGTAALRYQASDKDERYL